MHKVMQDDLSGRILLVIVDIYDVCVWAQQVLRAAIRGPDMTPDNLTPAMERIADFCELVGYSEFGRNIPKTNNMNIK